MYRPILTGIILTALAVGGCSDTGSLTEGLGLVDRSGCAEEAERLVDAAEVYIPDASARPSVQSLPAGRFIYRCGVSGDWTAVMFPEPGGHVDCAKRPPASPCPTGWINGDPATERFD